MPDEDSDNSFSDMPPLKDVDDDDDSDDAENSDNEVDEDEDDDVVVIGDEDDAQMKAKLGMPFFFLHCMVSYILYRAQSIEVDLWQVRVLRQAQSRQNGRRLEVRIQVPHVSFTTFCTSDCS